MARTKKAVVPTKTFRITEENFERVSGSLTMLDCCAFVEYSGLDDIETVEDLIALRRAASGDVDIDLASLAGPDETDGAVLVTTNSSQSHLYPLLIEAGFKEFQSFERAGAGLKRTIKLWGARVLGSKVAKLHTGEVHEDVTIPVVE